MRFIILLLYFLTNQTPIYADTPQYARLTTNANLYKNSSINIHNNGVWCTMESSYFVEIILDFSPELYKVRYNGLIGYVEKEHVVPIYNIPSNPYPSSITTDIIISCYLRSTPEIKDTNTLTTLSKDTTITFLAKIDGQSVMDFQGSTWYLVSYNDLIGYVYSGYTSRIATIMPNIEEVSYTIPQISTNTITPFNHIESIWLTLLALLPTLLIIFLLYKPKKMNH